MYERETQLYAYMHASGLRLLDDVEAGDMCQQPHGMPNHPAWQLGHLTVAATRMLRRLGQETPLPDGWEELFAPGSTPQEKAALYPGKSELVQAWGVAHERLTQAAHAVDAEALAKPNPVDFLAKDLPTTGDLLSHVLTTHEAMHVGQLQVWRRLMGLPAVRAA